MAFKKYQKLILEGSNDGVNWERVYPEEYSKGEVIEEDSSDCGGTIENRWWPIPNEFICVNNDKYTVVKRQYRQQGETEWRDYEPLQTKEGELVEKNAGYCGYGEYWKPLDTWQCASVSDMFTTVFSLSNGGQCQVGGTGSTVVFGDTYWLDTKPDDTIWFSAIPADSYHPVKQMTIDGITSSGFWKSTVDGDADHSIFIEFYSKSLWTVSGGYQAEHVVSGAFPYKMEDGDVLSLSAKPATNWGFNRFEVTMLSDSTVSSYYENPVNFPVHGDCIVSLFYDNEKLNEGGWLRYNDDGPIISVEDTKHITTHNWYDVAEWWFEQHAFGLEQLYNLSTEIPHTLLYIDSYAFTSANYKQYTTYLNVVDFPDVISVGASAFEGLSYLNSVSLPACKVLDYACFRSCSVLSRISLPAAALLGARCFQFCSSLRWVYLLGSSVCQLSKTNLGALQSQFSGCHSMLSVIVPSSLYYNYRDAWGSYSKYIYSY